MDSQKAHVLFLLDNAYREENKFNGATVTSVPSFVLVLCSPRTTSKLPGLCKNNTNSILIRFNKLFESWSKPSNFHLWLCKSHKYIEYRICHLDLIKDSKVVDKANIELARIWHCSYKQNIIILTYKLIKYRF